MADATDNGSTAALSDIARSYDYVTESAQRGMTNLETRSSADRSGCLYETDSEGCISDSTDDLDNFPATDSPVGEDPIRIPRRSQQQRVLTLKDDYIYSQRIFFIEAYNNL